jgi:streptomycin 3"-adenylyltransferase
VREVISCLTEYLDEARPGGPIAFYLTGSAVTAGLRPNSDLDFVLVTERSLTNVERQRLLAFLLAVSEHTGEPARPIELTSIVVADVVPWTYPPTCDFQYGEWLRDAFASGSIPERHVSPDLTVMLATLLCHFEVLRGPAPPDLIDPVPANDLRRAIVDSLPSLLDDLVDDERNVILTLARMLVTVSTGDIVPKDEAARRVEPALPGPDRQVLNRAAAGYLGELDDDWAGCNQQVRTTADHLAAEIRRSGHQ